jgi:hypothetical protein
VRVAALLFALSAAVSWGVGGILLKRGLDTVAPTTILVVQYVVGLVAIAEGRVDEGRAHLVDALRAFAPTQMTEFFLHTLNALADSIPADVGAQLAELSEDIRSRRRTMPQVVEVVEGLLGL